MKLKNVLNPIHVYKNRDLIIPAINNRLMYGYNLFHRGGNLFHQLMRAHSIVLTENDRKVISLKNKHQGRRCFIIGNGPSLKIKDLDKLKDEITFACNKIYLAFNQTIWRPTYYSVLDVLVAENNYQIINELGVHKIFFDCVKPYFKTRNDITWFHLLKTPIVNGEDDCRFSINSYEGVYGGGTVIFPQIQLAYFMGIREIYLIGVDFSFVVPSSTGKTCKHGEVLEYKGEKNHFHPDYRRPGETWTTPRLDLQHSAFKTALKVIANNGGRIFNASRQSALDVFPKVSFDDVTGNQ